MSQDHGILFVGEMVRAILDGKKTQTRRTITNRNSTVDGEHWPDIWWSTLLFDDPRVFSDFGPAPSGVGGPYLHVPARDGRVHRVRPKVQAGDTLWVKEEWRACVEADDVKPSDMDASYRVWYEADCPHQPGYGKRRTALFMPRWASRLSLSVSLTYPQRLSAMGHDDFLAEGTHGGHGSIPRYAYSATPREHFASVWESINGVGTAFDERFVWVYAFTIDGKKP
jgi:hypothetical protein